MSRTKCTVYCQICLRVDRGLKIIDDRLSQFHNELCDNKLNIQQPEYCMECEHLLKKLWKFKIKCLMSLSIVENQVMKKAGDRIPLHLLYKLLPPSPLGVANRTFHYEQVTSASDEIDKPCMLIMPVLQNKDTLQHTDTKCQHPKRNNSTNSSNQIPNRSDSDTTILNLQDLLTIKKEINKFYEVPLKFVSNIQTANTELKFDTDTKTRQDNAAIEENIASFEDGTGIKTEDAHYLEISDVENDFITYLEHTDEIIAEDATKLEITEVENDRIFLETKEETIAVDETNSEIADAENDCKFLENAHEIIAVDETYLEISEVANGFTFLEGTDEIIAEDATKLEITEVDNDFAFIKHTDDRLGKKKTVLKEHCYAKFGNKNNPKPTLAELANIKLEDIVFDNYTNTESAEKRNKRSNKTGPKHVEMKRKKIREEPKLKMKRIIECTRNTLDVIDMMHQGFLKTSSMKGNKPFCKETLIRDLKAKFATLGELRSEDGTVLDKDFILSCLEDKVPEFPLRQLWKYAYGRVRMKPQAMRVFKSIQNTYKTEYETVFDIEYLNSKQKVLEEFQKRKYYPSYVNSDYKCQICYQGFAKKWLFTQHQKCHDAKAGDFICPICGFRTKMKRHLQSHRTTHEALYKCKLCPFITYSKESMVNHFEQHNGKVYECENCTLTFKSFTAYCRHRNKSHSLPHVCTRCAQAFSTEMGLKTHRTRQHQGEHDNIDSVSSVKCDICDLQFPSEEVYSKHMKVSHKVHDIVPSKKKQRKRRVNKAVVMIRTCRICNATGTGRGWLLWHFRWDHPNEDMTLLYAGDKTHLCHYCGKGFTYVHSLRDHLNTHTGALPYACPLCPRRFPRAMSLTTHRLSHQPPGKMCKYCGKMFRTHANLYNHVKVHIGDRRHKCNICEKGFLHQSALNEHIRGVHYKMRRQKRRVTEAKA